MYNAHCTVYIFDKGALNLSITFAVLRNFATLQNCSFTAGPLILLCAMHYYFL